MPARRLTLPLFLLIALVVAGLGTSTGLVRGAFQDATPAADDATPVAEDEATPVAEPEEPATEPVTLVFGYAPDESGDFLVLTPVESDGLLLTRAEAEADVETQVDFESPRNDNLPWIRYGNNVFEAYPVLEDPGLVSRWIYLNDNAELRPSTLMLQIVCVRGAYEGFEGTATFVSRGSEIGGTLVIALDAPAEE
jgi:hypothetical protein